MQKQPNEWTCLPTAFAMLLDVPVSEVLSWLGREGDEGGFHPQELIEWALLEHCVPLVILEADPEWGGQAKFQEMHTWLAAYDGVIVNEKHAAAWIDEKVYDPNFTVSTLDKFGKVEVFVVLVGR